VWWTEVPAENVEDMLYADRMPSLEILRERGVNCAGFFNVLLQSMGLEVPTEGVDEYYIRGGTAHWGRWFRMKNVLEPFDDEKSYPPGTIMFTDYVSPTQQGHISVVYSLSPETPEKIL
jgi:hypothetical protein